MSDQTTQLTGALVNVHVSSSPGVRASWLRSFVAEHGVHFVLLSEMSARHALAMRATLGRDWQLVTLPESQAWPDSDECAVLIDTRHLDLVRSRFPRLGRVGWWGHRVGRDHAPRTGTGCTVRVLGGRRRRPGRRLDLLAVHAPPGVDVTTSGLEGRPDRRVAWRAYMTALRLHLQRRSTLTPFRAEIVGGDHNESAGSVGALSPRWLAEATGRAIASPGGIDFVFHRNVRLPSLRKVAKGPGMDHHPVLFVVEL